MSPCTPITLTSPTSPSGPPIAGIGIPFALPLPNTSPFPPGFPEDLLSLFNSAQFLIPPGVLKPSLNPNYSKDIFDAILSMLDQFLPFLMLYKFFLPVLNLIICIIEVLCALMNPFALISAINKLFSQCIPQFLNLFPIFALIIMIISLLLLLLQLIEYIILKIKALINDILRNINALTKSFQDADSNAVLAIALKLTALLCVFQNLFVLLSVFSVIIEVIKDMLRLTFSIPPCEGGNNSGCCSTTTCPSIVQSDYTNNTGTFQYLPSIGIGYANGSFLSTNTAVELRGESWQLFDTHQTQAQAFSNVYDAYDISSSVNPKPIFFPTDAAYNATTSPNQAAYTVDLRMYYNPANWGRTGLARFIRFVNCIVLTVPSPTLKNYNNQDVSESTGVVSIAGGLGFEDNNTTILNGFAVDGITPISGQATLNNFIHNDGYLYYNPLATPPLPNNGYTFTNMTYTFKPNMSVLLSKQLVTLGCEPGVTLNRTFVNTVLFGDVAAQTAALNSLVNSTAFPNPTDTVACLTTALTNLQNNITTEGVAQFQSATTICLNNLQSSTNGALGSMVGIGFNPCLSTFTLSPLVQFTTETIGVSVSLNENNGVSLTQGMPQSVGDALAAQFTSYVTFGTVSNFTYDGYQFFNAQISSTDPGIGQIMVAFQNQILCTNVLSADPTIPPAHTLQAIKYQFVYTPAPVKRGEDGDVGTAAPRRDAGDISRSS